MTEDRVPDLARFLAGARAPEGPEWPRAAAAFAARHGAALGRELLRFQSLFFGIPPALRALDLAGEALAARGAAAAAPPPDAAAAGAAQFAAVYGPDAARVLARLTELDPVLRDWILQHAYGRAYQGPELRLEERERLAVLALAASDCWKQCASHLRACRRLGVSRAQLLADADAGIGLSAAGAARLRGCIEETAP